MSCIKVSKISVLQLLMNKLDFRQDGIVVTTCLKVRQQSTQEGGGESNFSLGDK